MDGFRKKLKSGHEKTAWAKICSGIKARGANVLCPLALIFIGSVTIFERLRFDREVRRDNSLLIFFFRPHAELFWVKSHGFSLPVLIFFYVSFVRSSDVMVTRSSL